MSWLWNNHRNLKNFILFIPIYFVLYVIVKFIIRPIFGNSVTNAFFLGENECYLGKKYKDNVAKEVAIVVFILCILYSIVSYIGGTP